MSLLSASPHRQACKPINEVSMKRVVVRLVATLGLVAGMIASVRSSEAALTHGLRNAVLQRTNDVRIQDGGAGDLSPRPGRFSPRCQRRGFDIAFNTSTSKPLLPEQSMDLPSRPRRTNRRGRARSGCIRATPTLQPAAPCSEPGWAFEPDRNHPAMHLRRRQHKTRERFRTRPAARSRSAGSFSTH